MPAITGPATCALAVRDSGDALVLTRTFTVAGPALVLGAPAVSPSAFYPTVVDGFRDSVTASWTSNKTAGHVVKVLDSRGSVVRRADLGDLAAGTHRWAWNGRSTSGSRVAVGSYRIRVDADDHAGSTPRSPGRSWSAAATASGATAWRGPATPAPPAPAAAASSPATARQDDQPGLLGRALRTRLLHLPPPGRRVRGQVLALGARSAADICCYGRISRAGSRVSKTAFRVTATVTGWRAYDVRRVAVSYAYRHKI